MKACQLVATGKPGRIELRDVPEPQPGPDEVVIQVAACGVNHLDLWLEEAALPVPVPLPRTPGGEAAGTVLRTGSSVKDWNVGDLASIQSNLFCGECEFCRKGHESLCLRGELLGVQRDGGFAEQVSVPARSLVRIPDGVALEAAAALTLAGSTAMHMLTERSQVKEGDWVLVMGAASGVGSVAIQIARTLGARVITTGSSPEKRQLGLSLGAEFAMDTSNPEWPAEVRKCTRRHGVDLVIEHVGGEVLQKSFECLARGGTIVTCGATAGREVALNLWPFFVKEQRLIGSYGRNRADIQETLKWAAAGKLKPVIDSVFPLDRVAEALAKLRARKVLGKVLVRLDSGR